MVFTAGFAVFPDFLTDVGYVQMWTDIHILYFFIPDYGVPCAECNEKYKSTDHERISDFFSILAIEF